MCYYVTYQSIERPFLVRFIDKLDTFVATAFCVLFILVPGKL
jgi:hypothetical protein